MKNHVNHLNERRTSDREDILEWAEILFPDGMTWSSCTILNVSKHGALLQVEPTEELPEEFCLVRGKEETLFPCTTRWRIGGQMGVLFIEALSADPDKQAWVYPLGDNRRRKEIRSPFLRHPLVIC
ncbi:MAG: hypothetical protein AAGF86_17125 [Pseudomonadota bacterium]